MNFTVGIDSIQLQVEVLEGERQRAIFNDIKKALSSTFSSLYGFETYKKKNLSIYTFFTAGTRILELKTGGYLSGHHGNKNRYTIYYISIEMAGLKRYDATTDKLSLDSLVRVVAYLNTNMIGFNVNSLDVYVDMQCPFAFTYAFCNKKASGVKYHSVYEPQPYATSHYIEKYDHTHKRVMKRAYLYNKSVKEGNINRIITRFELKLQPRFFSKFNYFAWGGLRDELDRYHILYFPTLQDKEIALWQYAQYGHLIRRRDLYKLGLDRYRVIPDTSKLEDFLMELINIHEHELNLPHMLIPSIFRGISQMYD
ncbi:MAG: hypothetical protein OEL19_09860 [Sulfurimonas sp.]|nr:hypothetical protein [Sulfurimonas sp.]